MLNRNEMRLGGTNGLTDFKSILGFSLADPRTHRALYVVTALVLLAALVASRWLVRSKTGLVLEAIRDNERRLEFLGYDTARFKILAFAIAGMFAGVAGLLYAPQVGIITPSQVGVLPSLEVVIWVAFGGRGTLWGAVLGAVSINWLRSVLTATYPTLWPIILGGLFVVVVMFFPAGLMGLARRVAGLGDGPAACGRSRSPWPRRTSANRAPEPMDTLLYVEDLTVSFDGFLALRKLNLIVERQERIRLLIGPNGAGKTTFFDVLTGGVRPTAGRVVFGERTSLPELSTHAIAALGVCRKFQTPSVFPGHTVLENMILAAGRKGFTATLAAGTSGGDREAIAAVLEQVGLREEAGRLAGTLAHGQKQWLEIAMLLLESPTLLLLDEPVAGMTRPEKEKTGALLESIVERSSCTVMLIEHDMEFVRQVARRGNRVTVLHEGSVLSEGPLDQVQADERVIEAYLGRGRVRRALAGSAGGGEGLTCSP